MYILNVNLDTIFWNFGDTSSKCKNIELEKIKTHIRMNDNLLKINNTTLARSHFILLHVNYGLSNRNCVVGDRSQ